MGGAFTFLVCLVSFSYFFVLLFFCVFFLFVFAVANTTRCIVSTTRASILSMGGAFTFLVCLVLGSGEKSVCVFE